MAFRNSNLTRYLGMVDHSTIPKEVSTDQRHSQTMYLRYMVDWSCSLHISLDHTFKPLSRWKLDGFSVGKKLEREGRLVQPNYLIKIHWPFWSNSYWVLCLPIHSVRLFAESGLEFRQNCLDENMEMALFYEVSEEGQWLGWSRLASSNFKSSTAALES